MKSTKATLGTVLTLALAMCVYFALAIPNALAGGGDFLDPAFDSDGRVTTDFNSSFNVIHDMAIQPDGKIVAVGTTLVSGTNYDIAVARYNSNGTLDTSFSSDGLLTTDLSSGRDDALGVAIRPDGRIVVVGYCESGGVSHDALVRYLPNGVLDTTFGSGGTVCGTWTSRLTGIALQPDGKIVASGTDQVTTFASFGAYRYNANGTNDLTFNVSGRSITPFYQNDNSANSVAIQPDGKILVAGYAHDRDNDYNVAVARFLPNGERDGTFGPDNTAEVKFNYLFDDSANAIAVTPNGRIYVAGAFQGSVQSYDFGLLCLLPDGSLDNSFNGNGYIAFAFAPGTAQEAALDMVVQPSDGKVVLGGYAPVGGTDKVALARINPSGSFDTTFGTDGLLTHDFGGGGSGGALAYALAVQSDGKIVSAGASDMGATNGYDFSLARYLTSNATPTPTSTPPLGVTPTGTPSVCTIEYTDVLQGSTFYDFVHCLACRGVIGGYETGCDTGNPCFRPNNNLTRGQLSKIVSNAAGFNDTPSGQQFEDVPIGSTYYEFVWRLAFRSIISGYACGGTGEPCGSGNLPYFRPNANVTRGQTSKIVAIARNLPAPSPTQQSFEDVPLTHTFREWIEALSTAGAISGYACGGVGESCGSGNLPYFRPGNNVTRGQSSKIITNAFFPSCVEQANRGK